MIGMMDNNLPVKLRDVQSMSNCNDLFLYNTGCTFKSEKKNPE
jgi:hypothetical protein